MAKMTLTDALDKLNTLSLKARTDKLNLEEQAEFDALESALSNFELPSNGKHASGSFYNPSSKVKAGPTGQVFKTRTLKVALSSDNLSAFYQRSVHDCTAQPDLAALC